MFASSPAAAPLLVIGAGGQLGTDLMKVLADQEIVGLAHSQLDITQPASVREALAQYRPRTVVNTAAYNLVDECEAHPERGLLVNALGAYHLAAACREIGATLVHFSTDYVFDGAKTEPYSEEDCPHPISAYGVSKLAGEHFVRYLLERHLVIRTSGLYGLAGSRGKGGNFVERMLRMAAEGRPIKVVNDQTLAPTYTLDLARAVKELILGREYGLYHITNGGSCTWHRFAQEVFRLRGLSVVLTPTTTQEFGSPARRPRYSVLEGQRLREVGLESLRPWQEALSSYLEE